MNSVNKVILVGNVGSDPEIRTMQSGDKVASFSIATSESWKDKATGEKKERTEWHRVVVFNQGLLKVIEGYVSKGTKIYIEGQLETRSWEQDGQKKYSTEVTLRPYRGELVLVGSRSSDGSEQPTSNGQVAGSSPAASASDFEDEIPFMRHDDFIGA
jgi:single-strand DNA-binding protein